jgi:hypothetical protein
MAVERLYCLRPPGFDERTFRGFFFYPTSFFRQYVLFLPKISSAVNKYILPRNACQHLAIYTVRSAKVFGKIYFDNVHKKSKQSHSHK